MTKVFLTVFDHNEDRGYHFRKAQRSDWESAVRLENQAIRMLSDEHRASRIRLFPLADGAFALMRTASFQSDQRSALKTVSLLVHNPVGPTRWRVGLLDLLEKALTTTSEGGEMNFDLNEARHASSEHLTPMFEASLTLKKDWRHCIVRRSWPTVRALMVLVGWPPWHRRWNVVVTPSKPTIT